jgi:prepilin-type N-terminal cleavage/methylation domain-containing protein
MISKHVNKAFTLVEILVAMAVVVSIVSMVYGSFVATSRSAETYRARMTHMQIGQKVLEHLARQMRGCYLPSSAISTVKNKSTKPDTPTSESMLLASRTAVTRSQKLTSIFNGNDKAPDGHILRFITANAFASNQDATDGLFEVAYRFDPQDGLLFASMRHFIPNSQDKPKDKTWQLVAENIDRIDLTFFDSIQWSDKWDFAEKKTLPHAVKIEITQRGKKQRTFRFATTARLYCSNKISNRTKLNSLQSAGK